MPPLPEVRSTDVFLDFETYYDKVYSLKKLGIGAYVHDPRFEVHMLAIARGNEPVRVVDPQDITRTLQEYCVADPSVRTFIQNARFDGFITTVHYGIVIANPICTRCMERWTGMSRICGESLAAQSEFLGTGEKGTYVCDAAGRHLTDFTEDEMARYKAYCQQDVELLRRNAAMMLSRVSDDALDFISLSVKMYTDPKFVLDAAGLEAYAARIKSDRERILAEVASLFSLESTAAALKALRSSDRFREMVESVGGKVPTKRSEKRDRDVPALAKTNTEFTALQHSENKQVATLVRARLMCNSSIESSRCQKLQEVARRSAQALLPVPLEAFNAHTGRYSAGTSEGITSDGVNLQNLSKRTGDMSLRKCVLVPAGYKLVACDSSQIEARVLAWLAGEQWLLQDFANKEDPYCRMAAEIFQKSYEDILDWTKGASAHNPEADPILKKEYKTNRNVGKTAILQLGYYAGAERLADYLLQQGIMLADTMEGHNLAAKHVVDVYRSKNRYIKAFWKRCDQILRYLTMDVTEPLTAVCFQCFPRYDIFGHQAPVILLPDGYPLVYANLRRTTEGFKYDVMKMGRLSEEHIHSGVLCNNLTQATAFAIIRWQALQINKRYPIRINIHDSLGVLVPEDEAEECRAYMELCMRSLPPWAVGLPVDCESEIGTDFCVA